MQDASRKSDFSCNITLEQQFYLIHVIPFQREKTFAEL